MFGLVPFMLMFGVIVLLLTYFPGWKSPFSNTIGYLAARMMGVRTALNEIMKSNFATKDAGLNRVMENLKQDSSLLVNTMTPGNFTTAMAKLKPLLRQVSSITQQYRNQLEKIVFTKDKIAESLWLFMVGYLMFNVSSVSLDSKGCGKSLEEQKKEIASYEASLKKKDDADKKEQSKQRVIAVRD